MGTPALTWALSLPGDDRAGWEESPAPGLGVACGPTSVFSALGEGPLAHGVSKAARLRRRAWQEHRKEAERTGDTGGRCGERQVASASVLSPPHPCFLSLHREPTNTGRTLPARAPSELCHQHSASRTPLPSPTPLARPPHCPVPAPGTPAWAMPAPHEDGSAHTRLTSESASAMRRVLK